MKTVAEYKRLDELCHLNMGQSPDSNSYNDNGEGLPFYQGNADFGVIHPKVRVWCNAPTKIVDEGSLLISVRAPIGALNIANERCCIGRGLAGITSKDGVNQKYIYYCLKGKNRELNAKGTGSTFKAIAKNALGEMLVKVVSEEEQEKIVFSLDKITTIIESRKQQLQELDNLVKARFVEMFGDIVVNTHSLPTYLLKDLALLITKGASPNWQGFNYIEDEEQTLFITSENVREGYLDFSKSKYIEDGFNEKQKRSVLQKGDFLINIVGASIGRAAQFKIDKKANINQAVALVRVEDERIVDGYLLEYLNSEKALQMYFAMQSDTGRANLSLEDIGNLVILLPPVNEQRIFDGFVQQINKSKVVVQKALDEAQTLFDSLMQEYFG